MKKISFAFLSSLILCACGNKTKMTTEKRYTTPEEEIDLMHAISKDSFIVNEIPKPVEFKIKNSSTISFEVNTMITDGHLCQPIIDIRDSMIYVSYKTVDDSSRTMVYDLVYPITLVYQITDINPLEKNYKVLFTYPKK